MKNAQLLSVILSFGILTACGGGSDGDSNPSNEPKFSVSASQSSITASENQEVNFSVSFNNNSGNVSLTANTSNIANVGSVDFSASGTNVSITFNELDTDITHNLVINAQDGSGNQASTTIAFSVTNESVKPKLIRYNAIKANLDSLINAEQETQVFKAITDIARMAGTLTDNIYFDTRTIFNNIKTQNQQNYASGLRETIGDSAPVSEKALDDVLAGFDSTYRLLVTPLNELINSNQSIASELFPALSLGTLYTSEDGLASQFWNNPEHGSGTPYTFDSEYDFLTNLVMSNDQTCQIEL